jgi:hypothetical protein
MLVSMFALRCHAIVVAQLIQLPKFKALSVYHISHSLPSRPLMRVFSCTPLILGRAVLATARQSNARNRGFVAGKFPAACVSTHQDTIVPC